MARRLALTAILLGMAGLAAGLALASSGVPTPNIASGPSNPASSTSATFYFSDSQKAVTFQCALDGSAYSACSSPKAYTALADGTHVFQVQARSSTGALSSPASYSWRVDTAPPAVTIALPLGGRSYNAAGWQTGCSSGAGVCGGASDPSGVAGVAVSIKQNATGRYWNGKSYSNSSETYLLTKLSSQTATTAGWFYALPLPSPDGGYTLHALASDKLGNYTPSSAPASSLFAILTVAPPAPAISSQPSNPSTSSGASFSFSDSLSGVSFQCQLDGGGFSACASPRSYSNLGAGSHTFGVRAIDAAGNASSSAQYTWQINAPVTFAIKGDVPGPLYPGGPAQRFALTLTNPNPNTITVTSLSVSVQSTNASGCSTSWFAVAQPAQTVTVPANGSVTLTGTQAPMISMIDTATNQDACQKAKLALAYSGSAQS